MKRATLILLSLCVQSTLSQPNPGAAQAALRQQGDAAVANGDFDSAMSDYYKAFELDGSKDIELLKRIATLRSWKRDYSGARELLGTILERYPSDEEAASSLEALDIRRGLQLSGSYGEGEIDYTRKVFSLRGFYGGVDWLDLHAGYSRSDKPFYNRAEFSFDAYCFPSYRTYVRLGTRQKNYTYPSSSQVPPDNNAYTIVSDYQIELGYYYTTGNHISLEFEYFTPRFYWNNGLRARNYKIGASLRQWIARPVYAKLFAAILHDPDPATLVLGSSSGRITGFSYENAMLIGGAMGFDNDRVNAEVKFIPDRDLDRSLNWSLFATFAFTMNAVKARYDFLYDRYPTTRAFAWSQVHIISATMEPWPVVAARIGLKTIIQNGTIVIPFVALQINSGL